MCVHCQLVKDVNCFHRRGKTGYKSMCKICRPIVEREYRSQYRSLNKESIRKYGREYESRRKEVDPIFKMKRSIRSLISRSFTFNGFKKNTKTEKILGCDMLFFFSHIESLFLNGMSWDNRNEWHIDHIIPLMTAQTEQDILKLNHHSNLRPLWIEDNLSKRFTDKLIYNND